MKRLRTVINVVLITLIVIDIYLWFNAEYNAVTYYALGFIILMYVITDFNAEYVNKIGNKLFKD